MIIIIIIILLFYFGWRNSSISRVTTLQAHRPEVDLKTPHMKRNSLGMAACACHSRAKEAEQIPRCIASWPSLV